MSTVLVTRARPVTTPDPEPREKTQRQAFTVVAYDGVFTTAQQLEATVISGHTHIYWFDGTSVGEVVLLNFTDSIMSADIILWRPTVGLLARRPASQA